MATAIVLAKQCTICKEKRPLSEFHRDASRGDGLDATCKVCKKAACKRYGKSDGGKATQRRYAQTQKGKAKKRRHYLKIKDTLKWKARNAVRQKINTGKMNYARMLACAFCGKQASSWHHHLGYKKQHWLDVIPLCKICHANEHKA